jgi:hypothetical protein
MPKKTDISSNPKFSVVDPWAKRGEEDINYQRQAQLAWWTLLGGIAVAALLTQAEILWVSVQSGHWYYIFYFFATCFVIVNAWVQTSWGALVLRWPITVPTSIMIFFGCLALSIAALNITRPWIWYASITLVLIFSQLMQYTFKNKQAWVALPQEAIRRAKVGIIMYWFFVFVTFGSCIFLLLIKKTWIEIAWSVLALVLSSLALYWQHAGMQEEKKRMGIA